VGLVEELSFVVVVGTALVEGAEFVEEAAFVEEEGSAIGGWEEVWVALAGS